MSATSEKCLAALLEERRTFPPTEDFRQRANANDPAIYDYALRNPEAFWAEIAKELHWHEPWTKTFEWNYPSFGWFLGGRCNITYNCLDRHVKAGKRNHVAYIFANEDGTEQQITYGQLLDLVGKIGNGLKSLGVKKGDRVVVYMPLCIEGVASMLACARIGAVHSVVYAGFSVQALRSRIQDAQAHVVITGDIGFRRGKREQRHRHRHGRSTIPAWQVSLGPCWRFLGHGGILQDAR